MSDRRRASRYVLETPLRGQARPMQDAVVEEFSGDRLVVIAPSTRRSDEEVLVHLATPNGVVSYAGQVVESTAVSMEGTVSFRLQLRVTPTPERA
jgi:hypothetical protein